MSDEELLEPVTIMVGGPGEHPDPAPTSDAPESGIEDLRRQLAERDAAAKAAQGALEEANRRTKAAQEDAQRSARENQTSALHASEAEFNSIVSAISANQQRADALAQEKSKALSDGDFDKASKIDVDLGRVTARIVQLEDGKMAVEEARKSAPREQQRPEPNERERREQWLSSQNPHNAAWIRQNYDRFFGDPAFQTKAIAASQFAVNNKGLQIGTSEYLTFLDQEVGLKQRAVEESKEQAAPRQEARKSPAAPAAAPNVSAPPSRTVPTSRPGQGTPVTLTQDERNHARATLTPDIIGKNPDGSARDPEVVFAQHKLKAIAEGRWHGPTH